MATRSLFIFADGGARGNPGPAAIGFIIKDSKGKILKREGKYIGETTNNVAEYQAVVESLKWIKKNLINSVVSINSINFFLDSKLIVNQLNGLFKIKNSNLRSLIVKVRQLEQEVGGNVSYNFIPREKNKEADTLVNQSLEKNVL